MLRRARAMMARATLLSALLVLAPAAPAAALTCVHHPFQAPGERFGTGVLVAEIEVLDLRPRLRMDVRVLRVLHGREERPVVSVDIEWVLDWNMPQRWGFEPFSRGTQWVIVMRPAQEDRAAAWQPELCRAFLEVDGKTAVGYVGDVSTRERVMLEVLAARAAPSRAPVGAPTRSR